MLNWNVAEPLLSLLDQTNVALDEYISASKLSSNRHTCYIKETT